MSESSKPSTTDNSDHQQPRSPSGSQSQHADDLQIDNDSLQSVAGGTAAEQGADESGNRALHSVASGPNPNVGRENVERTPAEHDGQGRVEST